MTNAIRRAYEAGTRDASGRPGPNYWQLQTDYTIAVRLAPVRTFLGKLSKRFDHDAVDSALKLRGLKPWITKPVPGRKLDRARSLKLVVAALKADRKGPVKLIQKITQPSVTRNSLQL